MRFGMILEYDGKDFHGSQFQSGVRTVQSELEVGLFKAFGENIRASLASRTDSGVHALGQVAACDVETTRNDETLRRSLNFYLPEDLKVRRVCFVDIGFDPRRDAEWKEYVYTVNDAPSPPTFYRHTQAYSSNRLNEVEMSGALSSMVGKHDFAAFAGPAASNSTSTVRTVKETAVYRDGDAVTLYIKSKSFLHQQIRRIAGGVVAVGSGKLTKDALTDMLATGRGKNLVRPMPPHGLCLINTKYVNYPALSNNISENSRKINLVAA